LVEEGKKIGKRGEEKIKNKKEIKKIQT